MKLLKITLGIALLLAPVGNSFSGVKINNGEALAIHTNQNDLGNMSLQEIRLRGLWVFSTPFTKADGYGDGPVGDTPEARNKNGGRPTINANGTFSRFNGLDSQTCLECHSVLSRATIPMKFGIGGVGGINNSPVGGATFYNINDDANQINFNGHTTGKGNINGRVINPPFLFGSGGIELLANEMTEDLQDLANALQGGDTVSLDTKGVNFGTLTRNFLGTLDTSAVTGIENDPDSENFLVVQPFGRKGNNKSIRTFDQDAMQFHLGMQSDEILYKEENGKFPKAEKDGLINIDGDGDGVFNEILIGDLSVLSVFNATLEPPFEETSSITTTSATDPALTTSTTTIITDPLTGTTSKEDTIFITDPIDPTFRGTGLEIIKGRRLFTSVGCSGCHTPVLETRDTKLGLRYPEVAKQPSENVFIEIDLDEGPTNFDNNNQGGISVRLFADLKIHDMGPEMAEANGDANFTTARLWGVADTAPYLHDGRALTIRDAIDLHGRPGSDAELSVRTFFDGLTQEDRDSVYAFLGTLRTPKHPAEDLL